MRIRGIINAIVAALSVTAAVPALATDLLPPPEPAPVGCVYARLDGGGAFHVRPNVFRKHPPDYEADERGFEGGLSESLNEELQDSMFIEGGFGCQVNDILRVDATGGYRFKSSITDGSDWFEANLESYTIFANAYWDITNYGGFTPYVGGGVGAAFNNLTNIQLVDTEDGENTSFAWNVTAGVSYDLAPQLKVDVAYRFTDLGTAISGGWVPLEVDTLESHEFKIGLRYYFGW